MDSPVKALMAEYHAPMTRDEYLRWNLLGNPDAEEEAEMPKPFAYPTLDYTEMPKSKIEPTKKG